MQLPSDVRPPRELDPLQPEGSGHSRRIPVTVEFVPVYRMINTGLPGQPKYQIESGYKFELLGKTFVFYKDHWDGNPWSLTTDTSRWFPSKEEAAQGFIDGVQAQFNSQIKALKEALANV